MASLFRSWLDMTPWGSSIHDVEYDPKTILIAGIIIPIVASLASQLMQTRKLRNIPTLNPARPIDWIFDTRKLHFGHNSTTLFAKGASTFGDEMYRMMTFLGEIIVLPSRFVNDIRNEDGLSFMESVAHDFHVHVPGFEPFAFVTRSDSLLQVVVRKQLTKHLNKVTKPLSEESSFAVDLTFGKPHDWTEFSPYLGLLDIIARVSSRVFLGEELCRDERWLEITKTYTIKTFEAAVALRHFPAWSRRFVGYFHPKVRAIRAQTEQARTVIDPIVAARREAKSTGIGSSPDDAIEWFEQESQGRLYDPATAQLMLSVVAIHTSTDLITETVLWLAQNPGLVEELRAEIRDVLRSGGWKKTSLFGMKLLDSVVKEAQRLKPVTQIAMIREATAEVTLPDGTVLPKGTRTVCRADLRLDRDVYPNPEHFDGHRFAEWCGGEKDSIAHLVSTAPTQLGFGHGQHACPGRFFAANEIKVVLCHVIMKYDWKLVDGTPTKPIAFGVDLMTNPGARILVRRRAEVEIDLDNIE